MRFYAQTNAVAWIYITHCHVCNGIGTPWNETLLVHMYSSTRSFRGMVQYSDLANVAVPYNTWLTNLYGVTLGYVAVKGDVPDWCYQGPHVHHACGSANGSYYIEYSCDTGCFQGGTAIYRYTY